MPLKRPPSLSDSFIYYNFELAPVEPLRVVPQEFSIQGRIQQKKEIPWEIFLVRYALRFSFHILLIGLFETIFYFYFVSNQENNALTKDVNIFLSQLTSSCGNLTLEQKQLVDDFLSFIVNRTELNNNATMYHDARNIRNHDLFVQAWMYEVFLFFVFLMLTGYSHLKKINIRWRRLFFENIALIFFLGMYEFAFFSTIIFNYLPISAYELEANALDTIEDVC